MSGEKMSDAIVLPCNKSIHPVLTKRYVIGTPAIDEFYGQIIRCINYKIPGATTTAFPRYGKTYAIKYCRQAVSAEYPGLPIYDFYCQKKTKSVESAFFGNILDAVGHRYPFAGNNQEKRTRLKNFLIEKAISRGHYTVVFFVDEAQRLTITEYEWLRDVNEDLDRRDVKLIVFLVGQHELVNQKNALNGAGQTHITGRFMVDEMQFKGVISADDVATCLQCYDDSCYPSESDWPFTRFFFPRAYENGFRLMDCASALWAAFRDASLDAKLGQRIDIPMAYFARTIEIGLIDYSKHDVDNFGFSYEMWREAVKKSSFISAREDLNYLSLLDNE